MDRIRPGLFVLVETDLWPNCVDALKHRGVPAVLVNGRISPGSFARLRRLSPVLRPLYQSLDMVFAQSSEDREWYRALGVRPECVQSLGNLKFDSILKNPPASELIRLRESSGIRGERPVWIGGSTHEGEEEALLEIHTRLRERHRDLLLVLAPRRIECASHLVEMCREHGCPVGRRSLGETAQEKSVYLLDTLGELSPSTIWRMRRSSEEAWFPSGGTIRSRRWPATSRHSGDHTSSISEKSKAASFRRAVDEKWIHLQSSNCPVRMPEK